MGRILQQIFFLGKSYLGNICSENNYAYYFMQIKVILLKHYDYFFKGIKYCNNIIIFLIALSTIYTSFSSEDEYFYY